MIRRSPPLFVLFVVLCAAQAQAQFNPGAAAMRAQSRTIARAIEKNVERIIRPKLTIARGATGPVTALAVSRDERLLVTAVGDFSVRVWDLEVGRELAALKGHRDRVVEIVISPAGDKAASTSVSGDLKVWNLKTLEAPQTLAPSSTLRRAAFTAKGDRLVAVGADGRIAVFDLKTGAARELPKRPGPLLALALSPDDGAVDVAAEDGGVVRLDLASGAPRLEYKASPGPVVSLVQGEKNTVGGTRNGKIAVWDAKTGEKRAETSAHSGAVNSVSMAESQGVIATAGADKTVKLFAAADLKNLKTMTGHDGPVNYVRLDRQAAYALSASDDGTTRLWSALSGQAVVTLYSTQQGFTVVDDKGRFDGVQASLGGVEWRAEEASIPIENFSRAYYEPALLTRSVKAPNTLGAGKSIPQGIFLPPMVEIIAPGSAQPGKPAEVSVKAVEQGKGGVSDVRLFVNGKSVGTRGLIDSKRGDGEVVNTYQLDLPPGENLIVAAAANREQLESPPAQTVVRAEGQRPEPKLWTLTIGVDKYQNSQLNLNYAVVDATSVGKFFQGPRVAAQKAQALQLLDAQATKAGILENVRKLRQAPPQDIALIYLAGHGDNAGDDWWFIPHEATGLGQAAMRSGLSSTELKIELEGVGASRVFCIIDSCRSGKALDPIKDFRGMKSLKMLARDVGLHVLAATDSDQLAAELPRLGHGVFTYALLKGLDGEADENRNGQISVRELMRFVEAGVPPLSQRFADRSQFPTGHSRGTDFELARR